MSILKDYRKARKAGVGMDFVLNRYACIFVVAKKRLEYAFMDIFEENQMVWNKKDWIKRVHKVLAKRPSAEVLEKETPAFKFLRQNATEINKHLSDIQKLYDQLNKDDSSDEDSDEEFDEEKASKKMLMEEVKRLVKVMGDLAADLKLDYWADSLQTILYDMKKGGPQKRGDGFMVEVKLDNLSEEQLMFTPFMYLSHPPPEKKETGNKRE